VVARYLRAMDGSPSLSKYQRYRARKKAQGLKQVRIWTLDPDVPGFREAMNAAFEREKTSTEMKELNDWCEANALEIWPPYE
jgi:tRNA(Ile)-lysidine synthase TilS/MesJ